MSLSKRLFIAFLLIVAVGVVCWVVLPRYGLDVPPIVVILGYVIILAACVLAAAPTDDEDEQNGPGDGGGVAPQEPHIAGRIGPGGGDRR